MAYREIKENGKTKFVFDPNYDDGGEFDRFLKEENKLDGKAPGVIGPIYCEGKEMSRSQYKEYSKDKTIINKSDPKEVDAWNKHYKEQSKEKLNKDLKEIYTNLDRKLRNKGHEGIGDPAKLADNHCDIEKVNKKAKDNTRVGTAEQLNIKI